MDISAKPHEAGGYAQERYSRGLRNYRQRARRYITLIMGPIILAGLAGYAIEGHYLAWFSGAVFGMGVGASLTLWDSPPTYIENWKLGAEGERKTESALAPLDRSGWLVLHDVANPRGNYDHVVVGRAGVFMLDTKNHRGSVHVSNGRLRLRRRLDPEANDPLWRMLSGALASAAQLKEELQHQTGIRQWVQAVVVVWADFDEDIYEHDNCVVVHGSRLLEWLASQPTRLDEAISRELGEGVKAIAAMRTTARGVASR